MEKGLVVVIMAGGLGKRMDSDLPKVLHKIGKIPMIVHLLMKLRILEKKHKIDRILIVVGKYREIIEKTIAEYLDTDVITFIDQPNPLGTGHAIQCCIKELNKYTNHNALILSGDVPLLSAELMYNMVKNVSNARLMTAIFLNPHGYGRIVETEIDNLLFFEKIVEEKDSSEEERKIQKVNCGIYTFDCQILCEYLPHLKNNNAQKEYYLTDILEIIKNNEKVNIEMYNIEKENHHETIGVNTKAQLDELEKIFEKQENL
uniref:UDP-N-acetylglucosamine diphosphorylase n=1 Tax=viral metagenome TaxID=1070528 RepID=A0A6C0II49_9ZZZZ